MTPHPHTHSRGINAGTPTENRAKAVRAPSPVALTATPSRFGVSSLPFLRMERKVSLGSIPLGWTLTSEGGA